MTIRLDFVDFFRKKLAQIPEIECKNFIHMEVEKNLEEFLAKFGLKIKYQTSTFFVVDENDIVHLYFEGVTGDYMKSEVSISFYAESYIEMIKNYEVADFMGFYHRTYTKENWTCTEPYAKKFFKRAKSSAN